MESSIGVLHVQPFKTACTVCRVAHKHTLKVMFVVPPVAHKQHLRCLFMCCWVAATGSQTLAITSPIKHFACFGGASRQMYIHLPRCIYICRLVQLASAGCS